MKVWKGLAVLDNIVPIILTAVLVALVAFMGWALWTLHPWVFGGLMVLGTLRIVGAIAADEVRCRKRREER